jgi:hypothetical protein
MANTHLDPDSREYRDHMSAMAEPRSMTTGDHAAAWGRENGIDVPPRGTAAWREFYARWHAFAFASWSN